MWFFAVFASSQNIVVSCAIAWKTKETDNITLGIYSLVVIYKFFLIIINPKVELLGKLL